jgi:sec-independent protein translocase protein TatA
MGSMSIVHWVVVLLIVMMFFGPKKLGGLGKGLGEGIRGLREGLAGKGEEDEKDKEKGGEAPKQISGNPAESPEGSRSAS